MMNLVFPILTVYFFIVILSVNLEYTLAAPGMMHHDNGVASILAAGLIVKMLKDSM